MQETHPDHDKVSLERSTFFNSLLDSKGSALIMKSDKPYSDIECRE
jgi:hypothetical protein